MYTKEQIDEIFHSVSDESVAAELNAQAKDMLLVAQKSEHFRTVVLQFIQASLQSLSIGGFVPKGPALAILVAFLLGQRSPQAHGLPAPSGDPPIDQAIIDQWLKKSELNWEKMDGEDDVSH
jgi:hypothetical protein